MARTPLGHFVFILPLLLALGCSCPATEIHSPAAEVYVSDSGSVGFDIASLRRDKESLRIEATYRSPQKLAKFAIEFGPTRKVESKDAEDFPTLTGKGRFVAEPGSDATALLADHLRQKTVPRKIHRVQTLPFTFVNLGDNLSQASGGGFNVNPPGGWTAIKIFIGQE